MSESFTAYDRMVDGYPRVAVCRDINPQAHPELTTLLLIDIRYQSNPGGLPTPSEFTRAAKLEDTILSHPDLANALQIGHICYRGIYTVVFRASQPGPTQIEVKTGFLKKETFPVKSTPDPDWSWHEAEIAPTRSEFHRSQNHQIHETLEKNGDRSEVPRAVDFAAIFKAETDRSAFLTSLREAGLNALKTDLSTDDEGRFWSVVTLETAVTPEIVADLCAEVEEIAAKHQGEFDGWETILVR